MKLPRADHDERDTPPEGYQTWRPAQGKGVRAMAWIILTVIALSVIAMVFALFAT